MNKKSQHDVAELIHNDIHAILATIQCSENVAVCILM